jgi:hypothetical protein
MCESVAVMKDGRVVRGTYDGYGVIGQEEIRNDMERQYDVYHQACHHLAGEPTEYSGEPSEWADDQGYFFEERDYDIPRPIREPLKFDPYVIIGPRRALVKEGKKVIEFSSRPKADNFIYKKKLSDRVYTVIRRSWLKRTA